MQTCTYNTQEDEIHAPEAKGLGNEEEGKFILTGKEGKAGKGKIREIF